jgi:hypothetical protein
LVPEKYFRNSQPVRFVFSERCRRPVVTGVLPAGKCWDSTSVTPLPLPSKSFRINSGRAIAQAVGRWLLTVAARVRARVSSCGICGEQSGTGAGFLRVLRFLLPIFIPPTAP